MPTALGLLSASVAFGFASRDDQAKAAGASPSGAVGALQSNAPLTLAQATPQDDAPGKNLESGETQDSGTDSANDPLANYKTTLALLKKNYYGAPIDAKKTQQLTYESIRGMLGSLKDQFTSFLDPDEWGQMQIMTRGDFEGIGALLQPEGAQVKVARPIENSPAEKAGIKSDDVIVTVDAKPIKGKNLNDVVRLIKGKGGTKVTLGILRGKKELTFRITRARVEPPIVQHWMEDTQDGIGHIVLSEFNEKSIEQTEAAYEDLERKGMKALVFDLRFNPGGLLEVAIDVASLFIPPDENPALKNVVVYIREGSGREQGRTLRPLESRHKSIPLAVLVNDNSASASEIVTGAIKDYGVGTIIGERTFGKGKVQTLFPLAEGQAGALRLTTALYFPPKKKDINFAHDDDGNRIPGTGGILPDIEVKQSPKWKMEDFRDKVNDVQLHKAIEFLRAKVHGATTAQAITQVQAHANP